ncbi:Gfo/Idh/MocA family protein [Oceaniglobus trochenteri]|uniref:Gfo/Idh/MocA family protein n=1 Tax=Oceaniglobus trochenteri TaxID=2763260 RepID=UPI001D000BCA|nr:Gfo/Idh/MocA family oxidoreductase [Oceaniglobus trochenteri]
MADKVRIGLMGAGFVARVHADCYSAIPGAQVTCVAAGGLDSARAFAGETGIADTVAADALVARDDVDVVDICAPNRFHENLALGAIAAGKHVIVEKPLTGFFDTPDGAQDVSRATMLKQALASADRIIDAAAAAGVKVMYAENWVYAPSVQKARRLLAASGGAILEMRGEESHHGSHSPKAKRWADAGGGALIRLGSHPIGVMLHLKDIEGRRRTGEPIRPVSVSADVADMTRDVASGADERKWIVHDWVDVENWSTAIIRFSDGSRGVVSANDICLGGMRDTIDIFASNCRVHCDFSRSSLLSAYAPDAEVFADEYLVEKLETKAGWSFPNVDEHWMLGYHHELQDFVGAVHDDRAPVSDAGLGRSVLNVIYGAYLSAHEGRVVTL